MRRRSFLKAAAMAVMGTLARVYVPASVVWSIEEDEKSEFWSSKVIEYQRDQFEASFERHFQMVTATPRMNGKLVALSEYAAVSLGIAEALENGYETENLCLGPGGGLV